MAFTGIKDTDFLILQKLSDYELGKVCQVNNYVKELCENEHFWFNRMGKKIQESINNNFEVYSKYVKGLTKNTSPEKYINNAKNFYGFKNNKEFYKFVKSITDTYPNLYFYIFLYSFGQSNLINLLYKINKDDFPNWINYDEFIFHVRQKVLRDSLRNLNNRSFTGIIPQFFTENVPGFKLNHTNFRIPDPDFVTSLLGEMKKDPSGLPVVMPSGIIQLPVVN